MEKIEEINNTNIATQTIEKKEINNNENNETENIQSETQELKNNEKEKFEIDESILADNEELEKVMEAIINFFFFNSFYGNICIIYFFDFFHLLEPFLF